MEGSFPSLSTASRKPGKHEPNLMSFHCWETPLPNHNLRSLSEPPSAFLLGCDSSDWLLPVLAYSGHQYIGGVFFQPPPSGGIKNSSVTGLECSAIIWEIDLLRFSNCTSAFTLWREYNVCSIHCLSLSFRFFLRCYLFQTALHKNQHKHLSWANALLEASLQSC